MHVKGGEGLDGGHREARAGGATDFLREITFFPTSSVGHTPSRDRAVVVAGSALEQLTRPVR